MKVSSLKTMVGLAAPFLIDQDFIPILQHFWFRPNSVMAYNDIQAVRLMLDTGLNCAVPGKLLGKLLGTISHEEIDLKLNQFGTELLIGYGKNQAKLPALSPNEFVFEMPDPTGISITLNDEVKLGFSKCLSTVGHDPTKPERNGISILVETDTIKLYTTDGITISTFKLGGSFLSGGVEELWAIMPTFFCEQLHNLTKSLKLTPTLHFDQKCVLGTLEQHRIFSRLINAEPPKFEQAISHLLADPLDEVELQPIPKEFEEALTRAVLMLQPEKGIKTTTVTLSPTGTLTLFTQSERGTARDEIETALDPQTSEPLVLISDPNYLLRGTSLCSKIGISGNVVVFGETEQNFYHLVSTSTKS